MGQGRTIRSTSRYVLLWLSLSLLSPAPAPPNSRSLQGRPAPAPLAMRIRAAGSDLVRADDTPPDPVASNPSGTLESADEVGRGPTVTVGSNEEPPLKPTCRFVTKARRRAGPRALSGLRPVETVEIDLVARLNRAEINRRRLSPIDPAPRLARIDFLCRLTC